MVTMPSGHSNHLFINNGDNTFTDHAALAGVDDPDGRTLGVVFMDVDNDGESE